MNFPEGVTWTQRYITGGDLLEKGTKLYITGNLWKNASNAVIDFNGIDTSGVTDTHHMFANADITMLTSFNTSNVTDMGYMFQLCTKLTTIPEIDTSNVTSMAYTFTGCNALTSIPEIDTSNVTDMSYMFNQCKALISVPQLNTSKVKNMYQMFSYCSVLPSIPQFDTSKVTNMQNMFSYCSVLTSLPELDTSSLTSISNIWGSSNITTLTYLGGFKNLGAQSSLSGTSSNFLDKLPNLTKESIMNVINNLYDRKSAGYSTLTLKLGTTHLATLTDAEKAIATNKGWTLS